MSKSRNVKSLLAELDRREAEVSDIEARVRNLDSRYRAVWAALNNNQPLPQETKPRKRRKQQSRARISMGVEAKDVDLTGTTSRLEQLVRIAEVAPNNEVNLTQSAELLVALGIVAPSGLRTCSTSLHHTLKRHADYFTRIRKGWYRLTSPKVIQVPPVQWRDGDIDYVGCSNISQRLVRMAEHTTDGRIEPAQVAKRLLLDGQSSQRLDSLTRLVSQNLKKNPRFRQLGDNWSELVDVTPDPPLQPRLDAVDEMDSGILNTPNAPQSYMTSSSTLNGHIRKNSQEATD